MSTLKELSKKDLTGSSVCENIQLGCLQRIADACEKMVSNYQKMENDLADYKRKHADATETIRNLIKSISSLRGQNTKLKKKLNQNK
ncbi:MAG: hypothetical protein EPN37_15550 [Chitinophagaceae bacterium]|nr:MAG: hypothetical protein EPN37_15550 [Chitinophagaceae bacterium]